MREGDPAWLLVCPTGNLAPQYGRATLNVTSDQEKMCRSEDVLGRAASPW